METRPKGSLDGKKATHGRAKCLTCSDSMTNLIRTIVVNSYQPSYFGVVHLQTNPNSLRWGDVWFLKLDLPRY